MPVKFLASLNSGLRRLIETDPNVILYGEDLLDPYGGAFKVTKDLQKDFPNQVLTTPISEAALAALAGGMALRGLRPIVELMFGDFIALTADQLVNHISKYRVMYGDQVTCAPVFRVPVGAGRGYGPTHSQSLEKMFFGVPHLRVVAPSVFHDPSAMIQASVEGNEGTLYLEHKLLYTQNLVDETSLPDGLHLYRLGDRPFEIVRVDNFANGKPDVAVFTYGGTTRMAVKMLQRLIDEEFNVSLVVVANVNNPDWKQLGEIGQQAEYGSIVWEESTAGFDWGAEVVAHLCSAEWPRRLPVVRLASLPTVIPSAKELESEYLITDEHVERSIVDLVSGAN